MGSTTSKDLEMQRDSPSRRGKKTEVSSSPAEKRSKMEKDKSSSPKDTTTKGKKSKQNPKMESRDASEKSCKSGSGGGGSRDASTKRDGAGSSTPSMRATKVRMFRINVPASMEANDIMTIKLDGIPTKILITTPTSGKAKCQQRPVSDESEDEKKDDEPSCPPSPSSLTSSLVPANTTSYPDPHSDKEDAIIASTEAEVPKGKMIVAARPVIVLHAVFSEQNKQLKQQMIDEAMRQLIQESVNCGCNSILGMAISIKEEKDGAGYLVKASGTPCMLMPVQILVSPSGSKSSTTVMTTSSAPLRQRQGSMDWSTASKLERAA